MRIAIDGILPHDNGVRNQKETREYSTFSQKKIQVSTNVGIKLIDVSEIEFLKADGCYTLLRFTDKSTIISSKHLKNYECVLSDNNFYRIGRSYIINLDCITIYNNHSGGNITMRSGCAILVPRRNKVEFLKYLTTYLENLK